MLYEIEDVKSERRARWVAKQAAADKHARERRTIDRDARRVRAEARDDVAWGE